MTKIKTKCTAVNALALEQKYYDSWL